MMERETRCGLNLLLEFGLDFACLCFEAYNFYGGLFKFYYS